MEAKRLEELETICNDTTPGPWVVEIYQSGTVCVQSRADESRLAEFWDHLGVAPHYICHPEDLHELNDETIVRASNERRRRNAEFIATAKVAMPELIAKVRRLQNELEVLQNG